MAHELRALGWTVIEPDPARVIDGDGDLWIRMDDGLYYLVDARESGRTLADIREAFGIKGEPA